MNTPQIINIHKMKYVVQCFISDKTGRVVRISDYTLPQLEAVYAVACGHYGAVLPVPDKGNYSYTA